MESWVSEDMSAFQRVCVRQWRLRLEEFGGREGCLDLDIGLGADGSYCFHAERSTNAGSFAVDSAGGRRRERL